MHSLIHDFVYNDKHRAAMTQPSPHRRAYNAAAKELKKMKDMVKSILELSVIAAAASFFVFVVTNI